MLASSAARHTSFAQRTEIAQRLPAHTHRRSQVHDRLGIHRNILLRRAAFGQLPQTLIGCGVGGRAGHSKEPREHALDVAVENRDGFAAAEREDSPGRGAANARQRHKRGKAHGKFAAIFSADALRCAMQVACPGVVAKTRPQMQDSVDWSLGESRDIRKARDETLVVGNDRDHLRLLQHDFRDPHSIRRALVLPGQIVAAAPPMPLDERGSQARVGALHTRILATPASHTCPRPKIQGLAATAGKMPAKVRRKKDAAGIALERGSRASNRRRAGSTLVGGHSWTMRRRPRLR